MKYYYVKNVEFLYIDDSISRGGTGVYEKEVEKIVDYLKNAE